MSITFHLCHYNKARALAPLNDPSMEGFVGAQAGLYAASDTAPGFVWRLEDGAESVRPFEDQKVLVGLSVWNDADSLKAFTYGPGHADLMRRRRNWFEPHTAPNYVLWWKPAGELPTVSEGEERLRRLQAHGPTSRAFDFKARFAPPAMLLGTLGPEGTNSELAARRYIEQANIAGELQLFDTFEEVVERLLDRRLDRAVICTAYLKFSALYFERVPGLRITDAFVADLHPMVIATRPGSDYSGEPTFTSQPAILPLVRKYLGDITYLPAASNASAAYDVASGSVDAGLTTEVAAKACGLAIKIRMPALKIPFTIFERADARGALPSELPHFFASLARSKASSKRPVRTNTPELCPAN